MLAPASRLARSRRVKASAPQAAPAPVPGRQARLEPRRTGDPQPAGQKVDEHTSANSTDRGPGPARSSTFARRAPGHCACRPCNGGQPARLDRRCPARIRSRPGRTDVTPAHSLAYADHASTRLMLLCAAVEAEAAQQKGIGLSLSLRAYGHSRPTRSFSPWLPPAWGAAVLHLQGRSTAACASQYCFAQPMASHTSGRWYACGFKCFAGRA